MDGGEKDRDFVFQVTSVGVTDEQCGWMSSKVADAWCTGDGPTIPDAAVEMRLSDRLGAILPSGESLFVADDTYRIRVGSKY